MYIDSEIYLKHINDFEQIETMKKVIDKVNKSLKNYSVENTDFLDPYQRKLSQSFLNRIEEINYKFEGGIEEAERKSIIIFPNYISYEEINNPIAVIKISGNFKFNRSSHSDYLGAIMGLGVKREKVGDIFPKYNKAYLIISEEISDYILLNLEKIGKERVKVERVRFEDIEYEKPEIKEKIITISSERIDSFISEIYNISRAKADTLLKMKKVKVNFQPIYNKSKKIESENTLISIRGYGRSVISKKIGESKKGKLRYKIKLYL